MSERLEQQLQELLGMVGGEQDAAAGEAAQTRLAQMKIVERAVRPVLATSGRKRKMREELLAHLTEIYHQEQSRLHDPVAATEEAGRRFGDPVELAGELQSAVPFYDRMEALLDRWFGRRAPESALRYLLRVTAQIYCALFIVTALAFALCVDKLGWNTSLWIAMRPIFAIHVFLPVAFFLLGLLYFETRNTMFGVFGQRKSRWKVLLFQACFVIAIVVLGCSFTLISERSLQRTEQMLIPYFAIGIVSAIGALLVARFNGSNEIRDAMWARLNLET